MVSSRSHLLEMGEKNGMKATDDDNDDDYPDDGQLRTRNGEIMNPGLVRRMQKYCTLESARIATNGGMAPPDCKSLLGRYI